MITINFLFVIVLFCFALYCMLKTPGAAVREIKIYCKIFHYLRACHNFNIVACPTSGKSAYDKLKQFQLILDSIVGSHVKNDRKAKSIHTRHFL